MSAPRKKLKEYLDELVDKIALKLNAIHASFADKEDKSNKKQGLTSTDSDHYPSVPAVKEGIAQAILTAQGYTDDVALGINNSLENYVLQEGTKQLSDENYTLAEKQKLARLESSRFKGGYNTLAQLKTAFPEGESEAWHNNESGWYADVGEAGQTNERFVWDFNDFVWVYGGVGGITAEQVLDLYESNEDRNAYTDAEQTKLSGIEAKAQKNVQADMDETDQTKDSYVKNKKTKLSQFENDSNFVKDIIKVEGTGALEGGGALNQDREIDLTQATKDDIAKGVTAHSWGSHAQAGYQDALENSDDIVLDDNKLLLSQAVADDIAEGVQASKRVWFGSIGSNVQDLDSVPRNTAMKASSATSREVGYKTHGSGFSLGYNDFRKTQIYQIYGTGELQLRYMSSDNKWSNIVRTVWDDINLTKLSQLYNDLGNYGGWITQAQGDRRYLQDDALDDYATKQFVRNAIGEIPPVDLSPYMKTSEAEEEFAPLHGYPDWAQELEDLLNF